MSPEEARQARDHLQFVFVGDIAPPYMLTASHFVAATVDAPVNRIEKVEAVYMNVKCGFVRNSISGQIYYAFEAPPDALGNQN